VPSKKKGTRRRQPKVEPPQLSEVIEKLNDALTLIVTSYKVLLDENGGAACTVLHLGITQVETLADDLETIDLHQNKGRK
jgi:hypothetical protein